ncbi:putative ribokinase Ecym_8139 [Eremothecium cymbalariae DBVPG|uniref:Ribokinase n=1 Tax=Eremothecium cymbalariae (strain CBS 270.75 / DBVPG 7215 / KCTC 17166 / NRRL Y-17582) TaxID=931890 RepID=G8JX56_ERECY|nr:Hypothetical protein Ecym_8139 [Eremothecium cymbalariae DBVPG\
MGITVIGSLNYDLVTFTDHIPNMGETISGKCFETHVGGKGLNQAIALSNLKPDSIAEAVRMVGNIGEDSFGSELLRVGRTSGLNMEYVGRHDDVRTGTATILVEESSGQNRIICVSGANMKTVFDKERLQLVFPAKGGSSEEYVILQHEIPDPCSIMHWLRENRPEHLIVFNPSPFQHLDPLDWKAVDILVVNEVEALQLLSSLYDNNDVARYQSLVETNLIEGYTMIAQEFKSRKVLNSNGPGVIIITLGENGIIYTSRTQSDISYFPATHIDNVIDTTAAGDTFLGGVVMQLYNGSTLHDAVKFAAYASAIAITRKGASNSIPSYAEVMEKL